MDGDPEVRATAEIAGPLSTSNGPSSHGGVPPGLNSQTALAGHLVVDQQGYGVQPEAVPYDPPPDGPRYAAMGDAVTVNVIEWIGVRLRAAVERAAR